MLRIEILSDRPDQLGEGPLWDVREQRLYWIDSYGPAIHSCDASGGDRRSWMLPEPIGSMALREKGGAILSLRDGFYTFDFETGAAERIAETQPGELRPRMNDGKVDRQGRFVAGSMDFEESEPVGKLFRLDPDLSVHTLDTGIVCSNGPCWSPDGKTFYFADTGRKLIWAYDYDTATGNVRSRRVFTSFDKQRGLPDGATVDAEGFVWSCEVYSGRLIRFDPNGVVDRIVGLPVNSTTSLIFGGPNLDIAYVTSMARPHQYEYHREREAGFLFAIHGLGVRGIEEPRFRG
ncbi:SMP-30/gluconolactonase/LRE family protein [Mesorhizobium sp. LHD-90]|uniref:SMP-30/gluconolactonase/LRE family protein n=1 Tax=Mesorhizobium sp. LHD-90 TaxID=3071414 RepID=UPI0027E0C1EE|nr:SMP-30/gluconolactonase/LRE family protein [Mesorhizobium sp. LHD-90]MDQ6437442.1 SMP-30/gluconolactonase/LRE family protein [Mesorhizobium sp. LHD-90]